LLHHSFDIREYFIIPEAEHSIALLFEIAGPTLIGLQILHVLTTVEFDYQSNFNATKVGDVFPDRMLAPELGSTELSVSQMSPQFPFRVSLRPAQTPREYFLSIRIRLHQNAPHPSLSQSSQRERV
jgi:hypothetical protein